MLTTRAHVSCPVCDVWCVALSTQQWMIFFFAHLSTLPVCVAQPKEDTRSIDRWKCYSYLLKSMIQFVRPSLVLSPTQLWPEKVNGRLFRRASGEMLFYLFNCPSGVCPLDEAPVGQSTRRPSQKRHQSSHPVSLVSPWCARRGSYHCIAWSNMIQCKIFWSNIGAKICTWLRRIVSIG